MVAALNYAWTGTDQASSTMTTTSEPAFFFTESIPFRVLALIL